MTTIKAGAELGLYTTLGFAFQSIGLLTTTASKSAFLLYLNVKFVPFLALLVLGRRITKSTFLSAFLALCGTALLSTDGGPLNQGRDFMFLNYYDFLLSLPMLTLILILILISITVEKSNALIFVYCTLHS